jgi:hypothetical protein
MKTSMSKATFCSICMVLFATGLGRAGLNDGLVAYYPFSGNANDVSGQGHDGTVSGAVLTMDRFGNPDSAYLFDGLDDHIEVPNTEGVFDLTSAWTITAWCKPLDWMISGPVIWKTATNGLNDDTFGLACHYDNWILKLERASDDEDIAVTAPYTPSKWYYLVGTYDGQYLSLYIDGDLYTTLNCGSVIAYTGPAPLMIGSSMNTNHSPKGVFNGPVDEVRIYNRALSDSEVAMLAGIPIADADGPYTIYVDDMLTLDGSGSIDDDNDITSYKWDLDDDGIFETDANDQAVFDVNYAYLQSLGLLVDNTYNIHLLVTDSEDQNDTNDTTLTILPQPALEAARQKLWCFACCYLGF